MKKKIILFIGFLIFAIYIAYCNFFTLLSPVSTNNLHDAFIHFIDVGQGDSILIQVSNKNILIDSGPNSYSKKVIRYLKKLNIKHLDYVIATHPHEDHIGSMGDVIENFQIGNFYAPKITSNTSDFLSMVTALSKKDKKINIAKTGIILNLENDVYLKFLSPSLDYYDNLNNYSTVIKFQYKLNSFLFTGDSEKLIEEELLRKNEDISCNVLKIGHHGSKTSTSTEFIIKTKPDYAIISCGMGNDYGHPDKTVLQILKNLNVKTYRTDRNGTIIFSSDGKSINSFCEKQ